MEKTLLERLKEAKRDHDIVHVTFFNNGDIKQEERYFADRLYRKIDNREQYKAIEDVFCKAAQGYAGSFDFNAISMNLIIGIVFDKQDVADDNTIRLGAQPIPDVVRYYTGSVKSFLDDVQTNTVDYEHYGVGRQGYVNFNQLVSFIKRSDLTYSGPESFEELKERILNGEVFDISLSADLRQPEETKKQFVKK